jgi:hypothetical protein
LPTKTQESKTGEASTQATAPPKIPAELSANEHPLTDGVIPGQQMKRIAPPSVAVLPCNLQSVKVGIDELTEIAPPIPFPPTAEF